MTTLLHFYWPLLVAASLIGLASGILAFRSRRQLVRAPEARR